MIKILQTMTEKMISINRKTLCINKCIVYETVGFCVQLST